jgi:LmbE family N-acetylglucosaminyl deacetylase
VRALFLHAHYDDYEFTAAGTFEMWRRKLGSDFVGKVVVCTDGESGHHFRGRKETGELRLREQLASAEIGLYQFELLRLPNGSVPREGCLELKKDFLSALWRTIREFEPDYLFCPPLPSDPLAGVHLDHLAVADAIRRVGYLINVPHVYTPEYPGEEGPSKSIKTPVIIAVYDGYMFGENGHDLAVDIESAFQKVCEMSWCHQSQILEWLPWVGRHDMEPPASREQWYQTLRKRFAKKNRELGIESRHAAEVFTVTAWGAIPTVAQLTADFPGLLREGCHLDRLKVRLLRWAGA